MKNLSRRNFLRIGLTAPLILPAIQAKAELKSATTSSASKIPPVSPKKIILSRLTFGPTEQDLELFEKNGKTDEKRYKNFVEYHLHPDQIADSVCEEKIRNLKLDTLNKSPEQLWKDHFLAADALKEKMAMPKDSMALEDKNSQNQKLDEEALRKLPAVQTEIATWMKAVHSQRQGNEVFANFWHDHFSIFAWESRTSPLFVHYDRDVIRAHMFGNFREFLEAVAKSPAMLHYLDNELNQSGNPNENYARELFELHTLGAENYKGTLDRKKVPGFKTGRPIGYVDGDVYEAARAFTGWRTDKGKDSTNTGSFQYYEPWHDRFQKIILGRSFKEYQPPLKDGNDVLDMLADHRGTSRFIARKLCRAFVSDEPKPEFVERIAKVFYSERKSQEQIRTTLRAILLSPEIQNSWGEKVKRPFEHIVGILRQTKADFTPTEKFLRNFERTGQRLFGWRSPDGAPSQKEKWLGANSMLERFRLANQILCGQLEFNAPNLLPAGIETPSQIIDHWEKRILPNALNSNNRDKIINFLAKANNENHQRMAVAILFQSPEYQWK